MKKVLLVLHAVLLLTFCFPPNSTATNPSDMPLGSPRSDADDGTITPGDLADKVRAAYATCQSLTFREHITAWRRSSSWRNLSHLEATTVRRMTAADFRTDVSLPGRRLVCLRRNGEYQEVLFDDAGKIIDRLTVRADGSVLPPRKIFPLRPEGSTGLNLVLSDAYGCMLGWSSESMLHPESHALRSICRIIREGEISGSEMLNGEEHVVVNFTLDTKTTYFTSELYINQRGHIVREVKAWHHKGVTRWLQRRIVVTYSDFSTEPIPEGSWEITGSSM